MKNGTQQETLKNQILALLKGKGAHLTFDEAIADLPVIMRGSAPSGFPHSPWELLEHMRIAQWDILQYCRDPDHISPAWPEEYWPETTQPPDDQDWGQSVEDFRADLKAMQELVADPKVDLLAPLPHAPEHNILREALLLADHNGYHIGQLVVVRKALGGWPTTLRRMKAGSAAG